MPDLGNSSVFSQTDGSNNSGTAPSWSGSAAPSTLDDSGRALQGAITREWNWRNYTVTATGSANLKQISYTVSPAGYYDGQRFSFIANTTNSSSVSLGVNSLGGKVVKKLVSGALTDLASGDMQSGTFVEVAYNSANNCFVWVNRTGDTYLAGSNVFTVDQTINANLTQNSDTAFAPQHILKGASATAGAGPYTIYQRARGTYASPSIIINGDTVGNILWQAYDGSAYQNVAKIIAYVDGAPGAGDMPGALGFYTTADGTTTLTERLRITPSGGFGFGGANYGTSGQFLKSNGNAVPTWADLNTRVLLGTITTTGASTASLGSLVLTGYNALELVFNGVSVSATANITVGGAQVTGNLAGSDSILGKVEIDLGNGVTTSILDNAGAVASTNIRVGASGYSTATTTITLTTSAGTFDGMSVRVYGIK